ncbi:hypothetical protein BFF78_15770 [Streptomyces fodineus]|uniref:Major facilitator superfamily (MFS) profile domain-containing protein n=1 Tax=Streptomyces fodineus TaxID=1904616 RepID=A0A1D7Y9M8_9ACTN|nr:MFS transporter [Streptomyces fodineus]AOR32333.1 hypothetical protein BFF78_15770 [Streptomyces fodineus]
MNPRRLLPPPGAGRLLALSSFLGSIGFGLYLSAAPVYFVQSVGLGARQVGIGLSLAGLTGVLLGVVVGRVADRMGARETTAVFALGLIATLVAVAFVDSFWTFLPVITALSVAEQGWDVSREAVIAHVLKGEQRVRISAYLRSAFNAGFTLGVFGAGLAIAANTRAAYLAVLGGHALATALGAAIFLRLPRVPRVTPAPEQGSRFAALRDVPYLLVAQVASLMRLGDTVLLVGVPLWIVTSTHAPRALAAWLTAVNTLLVVLLQVRFARRADTVAGAARLERLAFAALAVACLLIGTTGWLPMWPAAAVLVLAAVVLTFGEMWGEGARWSLRYELAPDDAQGQYGGAFRLGTAVPTVLGPLMVTAATGTGSFFGWLALAAVFAAVVTAVGPVVRLAQRRRPSLAADG